MVSFLFLLCSHVSLPCPTLPRPKLAFERKNEKELDSNFLIDLHLHLYSVASV